MDRRFTSLRATLDYEGIAPEEHSFGMDYLDGEPSAAQAALLNTLLRGVLAERGNLLNDPKAAVMHGLIKGRALLEKYTTDNGYCVWRPDAVLSYDEWKAIQDRMGAPDMTCARLLKMLMGTKAEVRRRISVAAKANFKTRQAAAEQARIAATGRELARLAEMGPDAYHTATQAEEAAEPVDAADAHYYAKN